MKTKNTLNPLHLSQRSAAVSVLRPAAAATTAVDLQSAPPTFPAQRSALHALSSRLRAFTLVELLAVVACVALLTVTILSAQTQTQSTMNRTHCVNNLKQIGLAFRIWEGDYKDCYPMTVPAAKGGSMESLAGPTMFRHFQVMSNELNNPRIIVCPTDDRQPAADFSTLKNANLSYFAGLDADETIPALPLAGDRNLVTNGVAVSPGLAVVTKTDSVSWTTNLHNLFGIVCLADGSVQQLSSAAVQSIFIHSGVNTNRLAVP